MDWPNRTQESSLAAAARRRVAEGRHDHAKDASCVIRQYKLGPERSNPRTSGIAVSGVGVSSASTWDTAAFEETGGIGLLPLTMWLHERSWHGGISIARMVIAVFHQIIRVLEGWRHE